jgi:hypothetical protein
MAEVYLILSLKVARTHSIVQWESQRKTNGSAS